VRNTYIVSYDVCDDRRLRRVFKTLRGFGDHLQYSVFRCDLSRQEKIELRALLEAIIDAAEDQVLFADLGPVDGRGTTCMESIGTPYTKPERSAIIV
jgi:CRISPR-associated protein Cas2